jgi:hypothetical protein
LKPFTREQRVEMLDRAVAKIGAMQAPNGGFSLWGNVSEYEYWLSAYITNFLMDAREQGFAVPDNMYRQAMDFLLRGLQEGVSRLPATTTPAPLRDDAIFRDRDNWPFRCPGVRRLCFGQGEKGPCCEPPPIARPARASAIRTSARRTRNRS